jgi:glutathione S-transferase
MAETIAQKTIPTLYNLSSSQAHRVLWALEELAGTNGLEYNLKNFPRNGATTAKDLKAVFPLGKSPILTLEHKDGEPTLTYQIKPNVLTESRLILQFISDNYSNGVWAPESDEDKKRDIFFQEFANCTLLMKVDFALLFEIIPQQLPFGLRQLVWLLVRPIVNHFLSDQLAIYEVMEEALSEERPWFSGKRMGLADFNISFAMDMAAQRGYFKGESTQRLLSGTQLSLKDLHTRGHLKREESTSLLISSSGLNYILR